MVCIYYNILYKSNKREIKIKKAPELMVHKLTRDGVIENSADAPRVVTTLVTLQIQRVIFGTKDVSVTFPSLQKSF